MNKKVVVVGVIILIIGGVLVAVGYIGMMNESASSLRDDYNEEEGSFESYEEGDTVTVTGEITDKYRNTYTNNYFEDEEKIYELDDEIRFETQDDLGDEGDTVTVTFEVKERYGGENLEYKSEQTIAPFTIIGFIVMIVGGFVIKAGYAKGGAAEDMSLEPTQEHSEQFSKENMNKPPQSRSRNRSQTTTAEKKKIISDLDHKKPTSSKKSSIQSTSHSSREGENRKKYNNKNSQEKIECPSCGKMIIPDSKFCTYCGKDL